MYPQLSAPTPKYTHSERYDVPPADSPWPKIRPFNCLAPCGLQGIMRPWFGFWYQHCIYCLLVYIICFPTYLFFSTFLAYFLPYLSFPLRIDPLRFQVGCRKRRLNLALVLCLFCVAVHFFWLVNACFCCVRFNFLSIWSQETGLEKRLRNDLFCVQWDVKPQLNQLTGGASG